MNIYKTKRVSATLSRKVAAIQLEISWYHLRNIETGFRNPSLDLLVKMSNLYSCSIDEFLKVS